MSRLLALAIKLEGMVSAGERSSFASLAAAGQVSSARMSQIVALTNLAPAIQEQLLFLPRTLSGVDRIGRKIYARLLKLWTGSSKWICSGIWRKVVRPAAGVNVFNSLAASHN